jgi:hypothetical protein
LLDGHESVGLGVNAFVHSGLTAERDEFQDLITPQNDMTLLQRRVHENPYKQISVLFDPKDTGSDDQFVADLQRTRAPNAQEGAIGAPQVGDVQLAIHLEDAGMAAGDKFVACQGHAAVGGHADGDLTFA